MGSYCNVKIFSSAGTKYGSKRPGLVRNGIRINSLPSRSYHVQESVPSFLPSFPNDISKEVSLQNPTVNVPQRNPMCKHKTVLRNVRLKHGRKLATFELRGRVGSFVNCVEKCCRRHWCSLAFKVGGYCYSVHCPSHEACEPVKTKDTGILSDYVLMDRPQNMNDSTSCFFRPRGVCVWGRGGPSHYFLRINRVIFQKLTENC